MADRQFVSLKLGGRLYGVDILLVREIIRDFAFTPVETPLPSVLGLLNLRGQIITVVDPSRLLGLPPREPGPTSRCVILKTAGDLAARRRSRGADEPLAQDAVGLVVDGIADVVCVDESEVDRPPANAAGESARHLAGVVRLDGVLLQVLAVGSLLADAGSKLESVMAASGEGRSAAR